jgi:hypothetical protein
VTTPRFKLITSNSLELFEARLHDFVDQLDRDDMIVDVKFATTALSASSVEFSALVQYQKPESWG